MRLLDSAVQMISERVVVNYHVVGDMKDLREPVVTKSLLPI